MTMSLRTTILAPMARILPVTLLSIMASAVTAPPAWGQSQVQPSELARTVQVVDGTTITVEHYRPVARGRAPLFGNLVSWGELWTPGANWSTTLEVDRPVTVNGHALDAGRYSVWMVPQATGPWTVVLDGKWRRYHTDYPRSEAQEALRFQAEPETGPHMEALSWYVPVFTRSGAVLRMHWGGTWIDLDLTVTPTEPFAFPAGLRERYAGRYPLSGDGGSGTLTVRPSSGALQATLAGATGRMAELPARFHLYPSTVRPHQAHQYNPALMAGEELVRVFPEWTVVFEAGETGPASAVVVRRPEGVVATGSR